MGPPTFLPCLSVSLKLTASTASSILWLTLQGCTPHPKSTGPPIPMDVATPAIIPVPTVEERSRHKRIKGANITVSITFSALKKLPK